MPPSLLIHYFGTEEQMTIELVDYLLEVFRETYGDKLASIADPLERLQAILDEFFSPEHHELLDDRAFYACCFLSLTHPKVRHATRRITRRRSSSLRRRYASASRPVCSRATTLTSWRWP